MTDTIEVVGAIVPAVSQDASFAPVLLIDSAELARRLQVPESWVRSRTRARTPKEQRIPCIRLGRYVRFDWGSNQLKVWLASRCTV
jgi:hypothetical protein